MPARSSPDGHLVVFGRLGELIITGGENVWPSAVEPVLRRHVLVADAAVGGMPDPEWGERVVAYVVLAEGGSHDSAGYAPTPRPAERVVDRIEAALLLAQLRELVSDELAAFAAPREVVVVGAIPRTALGKVKRSELAALKGPTASV